MNSGQYLRIERKAGGVNASNRSFIKACHTLLSKEGKKRINRDSRHKWLREGLLILKNEKLFCKKNKFKF